MKKFISILTVAIISISLSSCREAEEISAIPENSINQTSFAKVKNDSTKSTKEGDSTNVVNNTIDEGDPKKDKIEW